MIVVKNTKSLFLDIAKKYSFIGIFLVLFLLTGTTFLFVNQSEKFDTRSRAAGGEGLSIVGDQFILNGQPFDMWGVRVGSASIKEEWTTALINNLDDYKVHRVNTVTVFYMGTSGGTYDPFTADGKGWRDSGHRDRMNRIIEAANERGMVVIVGIFYQNVSNKSLQDWNAAQEAVRTVTRELKSKGYRNVIVNIANEQSSGGYTDDPWQRVQNTSDLLSLVDIVHEEDPERLVGGGGFSRANNEIIGRSQSTDVLLFDTVDTQDSESLYYKYIDAGVVNKPIVNVEQFGAWTKTSVQGVMPAEDKAEFYKEVDRAIRVPGLYTFFHYNSWFQGGAQGWPNRFDLAGHGTSSDPGVRWYFEYVRDNVTPANPLSPTVSVPTTVPTGIVATPTFVVEPTATRTPTPTSGIGGLSPTQTATPTVATAQSVVSMTLIRADNHSLIQTLSNGATIDLAALPTRKLNVRVNTNPSNVGSVQFYKDGIFYRIENSNPYELEGDNGSWTPTVGTHTIRAVPFTSGGGGGTAGRDLTITITVIDSSSVATSTPTRAPIPTSTPTTQPTAQPAVTSFVLINADTNSEIRTLVNGETLDFSQLPTRNISIRAEVFGTVGSVKFSVNDNVYRIENSEPYALNGDSGSSYTPWDPGEGTYTILAQPYSAANATGTLGISRQITLSIGSDNTTSISGNGLTGYYYNSLGYMEYVGSKVDTTVDYIWKTASPYFGVASDRYTVRWTGYVVPPSSGTYTFYVNSDDGARLWVDNQNLIDKWTNHSMKEYYGRVNLVAGQKYPIRLDYYENLGNAGVQLKWSASGVTKQIIPQASLFTQ